MTRYLMFNMVRFVASLILVIGFFLSQAEALGLSPASKTIQYSPGDEIIFGFDVINSEAAGLEASLASAGDLKDLVFFENNTVIIRPQDYRTPIKAVIRMPQELSPGLHTFTIKLTPIASEGEGTFSAFISPEAIVSVKVPYPDKFADVKLFVIDAAEGNPVQMYVDFDNLGSQEIQAAGALVKVYGPDLVLVDERRAPEISVALNFIGHSEALPRSTLMRGSYLADVRANYDGTAVDFAVNFSIGKPAVRLESLASRQYFSGEINKISFTAYPDWNEELSVGGSLEAAGRASELALRKLAPRKSQPMEGFLDFSDVEPGEYYLNATLVYASEISKVSFPITVIKKPAIPLIGKSRAAGSFVIFAVLLAFLMLVLVIIVFYLRKKKRRRQEPKPDEQSQNQQEQGNIQESGRQ